MKCLTLMISSLLFLSEVLKMDIVLASNNRHKVEELEYFINAIFSERGAEGVKILTLSDIGFTEDIIEDGETFEENALIKASAVAKKGYIAVADDSGLSVDALSGEPGVYSARYAGEPCDDRKNNEKLLEKLSGVPEEKRDAHFVSVIAGVFPDGRKISARGECPGKILFEYRGNGGFGYDPLFLYEPYGKTYAEMDSAEKNAISHRARAMKLFAGKFAEELGI
ncbi:MAG: RdgB/HAM1 family non-canonical purine NTP pyrophosphatase [Eubacteriales bacterium]